MKPKGKLKNFSTKHFLDQKKPSTIPNPTADQRNLYGQNLQGRLTDRICRTYHASRFFAFPIPADSLRLRKRGFILTYPMIFLSTLRQFRFF